MNRKFSDNVRDLLLQYKAKHQLTDRGLSLHIFRQNGENYSLRTIRHFLADDKPEADWSRLAVSVMESIPFVAGGIASMQAKKVPSRGFSAR